MEVHVPVVGQPGPDIGGVVAGQVVEHEVDLFACIRFGGLLQKRQERGGVTRWTQSPVTSPVSTLSAAIRLVTPWRT